MLKPGIILRVQKVLGGMGGLSQYYGRVSGGGSASAKAEYTQAANKATAANKKRYSQGLGVLDKIIGRYQPGGSFGKGAMAQYERGKTKALSTGMQQLVSSGLSNTTVAAGLGKKYEEEVGSPFRLQLEDMRLGRLSDAEMAKVGFMERRQDAYPDAGLMAGMAQGAASGPTGGGGGGGPTEFGMSFKTSKMQTTGGHRSPGVYGADFNKPQSKMDIAYQPAMKGEDANWRAQQSGGEAKPAATNLGYDPRAESMKMWQKAGPAGKKQYKTFEDFFAMQKQRNIV